MQSSDWDGLYAYDGRPIMSTCTKCASLKADAQLEAHPALRRRGVSHTFLDVFENYVCLNCGANWERAILVEDKHPNRFRWKLTGVPIEPMAQTTLTIDCADLNHALASWIKPTVDEQPYA